MVAYWLGLIALGGLSLKHANRASDLFLGGRQAGWPMVGLALFASTVSTTTLVGVSGSAYGHGIGVYNYEWPAAIILCLFCAFVLPTILRSQIFTLPEYFERRYGRFVRTYVSGLSICLGIFVDNAGGLFAGSLVFQVLWPGLALWQVCALLTGLAGAFLIIGGLKIVMLTETVQGLVMLVCTAILATQIFKAAGGLDTVLLKLSPEHLHLIKPASDPDMPWTGLVTGVPLIAFYFWCTNQVMVQRILAARSIEDGRLGALLGGSLKLLNLFLIVLPGAAAGLLLPHLGRPDAVFSQMIFHFLPPGILGLILAAMIVSLLSGLAANFNAAATLISLDFIKTSRPDLSEARMVQIGRVVIIVIMVISAIWAPQVARFKDTLWQYIQSMLSYFVPPIACLFIGGLFWAPANAKGAAWGLGLGTALSISLFIDVEILHGLHMHFLVVAGLIFAVSAFGLIGGSLVGKAKDAKPTEMDSALSFSPDIWQVETGALKSVPFYRNYRVLSLVIILITLGMVLKFA